MTAWIWWTRRETVAYLGLVLVAAAVAMFFGGTPWTGSWKMALDWASGSLALVGPVVAGAAAAVYSRLRMHDWEVLVGQSCRGPWPWLHPTVALWAIGMGAVIVAAAVSTTIAATHGSAPAPGELVVVVLSASVLASQVLIGAWLGTRFPGPWAAPIAALGVFGLGALSSAGLIPATYRPGGVTGTLAGQGYDVRSILAQSAVAIAVAAVAAAATLAVVWAVRVRMAYLTAAAAVALAVGCAVGGLGDGGRYTFVSVPLRCVGGSPVVCMSADTTRPLRRLSAAVVMSAAPLRSLGVDLPERWVQDVPGREPDPGSGVLLFVDRGETRESVDPYAVAISLATPAPCAALRGTAPPGRALEVQSLVASWISVANGQPAPGLTGQVRTWLQSVAARSWVAPAYRHLKACDLDSLRIPTAIEVPAS